jgi:hypothetical protein
MPRSFYRFIAEAVEASMVSADTAAEMALSEEPIAESVNIDVVVQEAIIKEGLMKSVAGKA